MIVLRQRCSTMRCVEEYARRVGDNSNRCYQDHNYSYLTRPSKAAEPRAQCVLLLFHTQYLLVIY